MRVLSRIITSAAAAASAILIGAPSYAIPAWTRATGTPCNSCHFGASNRLTKMGSDFLNRGFRMPAQEGFTEDSLAETNFLHYASLGLRGGLTITEDANPSSRFATNAVDLWAGGPLMDKLGFWAAYALHPEAGLDEALLQYTSDIEEPNYWWLRVGTMSPQINWMAYRVPGGPGPVLSATVGQNNPYRVTSALDGIAAGYTSESGLRAELGVVNGLAAGAPNNHKDFYGTLQYFLDNYGTAIGLLGYSGKYTYSAGTPATPQDADFNRIGVLGQFLRDTWEVHSAYFTGSSDLRTGGDHSPSAFQVQFDYNLRPDHTASILYSDVDNDLPAAIIGATTTTGSKALSLGYAFRYTNWARVSVGLTSTKTDRGVGTTASDDTVNSLSLGWNFWF